MYNGGSSPSLGAMTILNMPMHKQIVRAVLRELQGRSGFDEWWDNIDPMVQKDIRDTLDAIVGPIVLAAMQDAVHDSSLTKDTY